MKKMILLIIFCFGINLWGQEDGNKYIPIISPPSQNAYKMSTYGNIPMENHTGSFNYSIPIYTIKHNDITLPISIGYNSNGIKIDEQETILGMDWTLSAGGVISRVMRGQPDEKTTRWYPENIDLTNSTVQTDIKNICRGDTRFDTEQDWFNFSVNGISGTFYFDENLQIYVNSEEYVSIEFKNEDYSSFTITDTKGYKYVFGGHIDYLEHTLTTSSSSYNTVGYYSAWFLKEIISPLQNKIEFIYKGRPSGWEIVGISESMNFYQPEKLHEHISRYINNYSIQKNLTTIKLISEINFGKGKMFFQYKESAKFLLDYITVSYSNDITKKIVLDYNTIESAYSIFPSFLTSSQTYRSFLKEIVFYDKNSKAGEKYSFTYHSPENLPAKFSYSKDKYGYPGYRNTSAFSSKIRHFVDLYNFPEASYSEFNANLEVNPDLVYCGMLKAITYPT